MHKILLNKLALKQHTSIFYVYYQIHSVNIPVHICACLYMDVGRLINRKQKKTKKKTETQEERKSDEEKR